MADTQVTIEDMNTFIDSLRYAQTLINTANAGADLSYDFLRSYDYYGTVRMVVATGTKISAPNITISGYQPEQFYQYDEEELGELFYKIGDNIVSSVSIIEKEELGDNDLVTHGAIDKLSILRNGSLHASYLRYDSSVSFDIATDDDNTLFPIEVYDTLYNKTSDTIVVDNVEYDMSVTLQQGFIRKPRDIAPITMSNISLQSGLSSHDIEFESSLETREEILKNVVVEDGVISQNAVIPEDIENDVNIATLNKLVNSDLLMFGDEVELHLEDTYTDQQIKDIVDNFMESSGSSVIYTGEDMFLTKDQAEMIADYIYRKATGIKQTSIQI
jgi:hypothetical protein